MATVIPIHSPLPAPAEPARARPAEQPARLSGWRLAAFSSFAVPVAAAQMPVGVYLPAIYAQHYGIPLATLGLLFLAERLWGAAADPVIGILSDRTRSRFGRRRPWIAAGGLLFGLSAIALFFPGDAVSAWQLGLTLFVFYLGWSMMQITISRGAGRFRASITSVPASRPMARSPAPRRCSSSSSSPPSPISCAPATAR